MFDRLKKFIFRDKEPYPIDEKLDVIREWLCDELDEKHLMYSDAFISIMVSLDDDNTYKYDIKTNVSVFSHKTGDLIYLMEYDKNVIENLYNKAKAKEKETIIKYTNKGQEKKLFNDTIEIQKACQFLDNYEDDFIKVVILKENDMKIGYQVILCNEKKVFEMINNKITCYYHAKWEKYLLNVYKSKLQDYIKIIEEGKRNGRSI